MAKFNEKNELSRLEYCISNPPKDKVPVRFRFTSAMSKYILETYGDPKNRGRGLLDKNNIKKLSAEMANGQWLADIGEILFSSDGEIIDGHHRFGAGVESGHPFESRCGFGLPPEAYNKLNDDLKRKDWEIYARAGIPNYATACSAMKMVLQFMDDSANLRYHPKPAISNNALVRVFTEDWYDTFKEIVLPSQRVYVSLEAPNLASGRLTPSMYAGIAMLLAGPDDHPKSKTREVQQMFDQWASGSARVPVLHRAAKTCQAHIKRVAEAGGNPRTRSRLGIIIKAVNATWTQKTKGVTQASLDYHVGGDEPFPRLILPWRD